MLKLFHSFAKKYPRLIQTSSNAAANAAVVAAGTAIAVYATVWRTKREEDPVVRQILWDNFLDVEGAQAALSKHRNAMAARQQKP